MSYERVFVRGYNQMHFGASFGVTALSMDTTHLHSIVINTPAPNTQILLYNGTTSTSPVAANIQLGISALQTYWPIPIDYDSMLNGLAIQGSGTSFDISVIYR